MIQTKGWCAMALAVSMIAAGCTGGGKKGAISGEITGAEGKTLYLQRLINNRIVTTDSTLIASDGSFQLVPTQPLAMDFYQLKFDRENVLTIITDSTESLVLTGNFADLMKSVKAKGSANTEPLRALEIELSPLFEADEEIVSKLSNPSLSAEEKSQLRESFTNGRKAQSDIIRKWLDNNSSSLGALMVVRQLDARIDMPYYNKVIASLEPGYSQLPMFKALKTDVQRMANPRQAEPEMPAGNPNVAIGKVAPELAFKDTKDKVRKLSDLRGKTVLLDFWASWCRPCRGENPNVVAAYKKYNKDGFEVFSVSLDRDKQSWIDAIKADGLLWPNHVSDLKYWDSEAAGIYGVQSIPKAFLIDKDGKIIASDLRGPALEAKLREIYGH